MIIAGIDFGTTNVRISTWDSQDENHEPPRAIEIGRGDLPYMPVVVALQKQVDNSVSIIVGEEADVLEDGPNTVVIRDIKRWTQVSDPNERRVKARFDAMALPHPTNWKWIEPSFADADKPARAGYIEVWGQQFQFVDLMREILSEAITRAKAKGDLPDEFEWRAGCPVHAGIGYRRWLNELLAEFSGNGNLNWIADEPVLFLTLLRRRGDLKVGSYLVYDLGGGSFDCALVQVQDDGDMIIYGADGHPLLGGSDIDRVLKQQFPDAPINLLRQAKEDVSPDEPVVPILAGDTLRWTDVEIALKGQQFMPRSLMALHGAYVSAKVVWGRRESDFPFGETIFEDSEDDSVKGGTGEVRFVWQLGYDEMARDMVEDEGKGRILNNIILYGGPTRSPFIADNLRSRFGYDRVIATKDLLPDVPHAELVALSMGACYFSENETAYMMPSRLPINATLTGEIYGETGYSAHQLFSIDEGLFGAYESPVLQQDRYNPQQYKLTITTPNGIVLREHVVSGFMEPGDHLTDERNRQPATSLRLIIDGLGLMFVEMKSEGVGLPWAKTFPVFPDPENDPPPWQTEAQRNAWIEVRRKLEERARNKQIRALDALYSQPWREGMRGMR